MQLSIVKSKSKLFEYDNKEFEILKLAKEQYFKFNVESSIVKKGIGALRFTNSPFCLIVEFFIKK